MSYLYYLDTSLNVESNEYNIFSGLHQILTDESFHAYNKFCPSVNKDEWLTRIESHIELMQKI